MILNLSDGHSAISDGKYRPPEMIFRGFNVERRFVLHWDEVSGQEPVCLDRIGSYEGLPPNWLEWQREG